MPSENSVIIFKGYRHKMYSFLFESKGYVCSHCTRSICSPVQKSIRYNVNSAQGNRTRPDWYVVELFFTIPDRYAPCLFWFGKRNLGYVHTIPDRFLVWFGNRSDTMWSVLEEIEPDQTSPELSCSHHIGLIFVLVWQKQIYLESKSHNEIPFQKRGRSAEQVVHIGSGAFQKAIWYGTYHFWNQSVAACNHHRNCAGPAGSNVNSRTIRYGFRGVPIIHPV